MSSEWQSVRLGDCCFKIGSGATPKGGKESYLDSGAFRLIRSQNVYNDGFHPSGLAFIGEDQARKLEGVSVEASDILLNITGDSVARVCLAPPQYLPARVNQHVAIIRPDPKVLDSRFLRYFLVSPQQQDFLLGLAAAGATRNALTKGMIEDLCVPCPDIAIQKIIADSLSGLDDRITLLRETNATLEAIAQALFKSWFVDFDPVHAKQEGRIPEGMDEAVAALFPDSFQESGLGLVPKGWQTRPLYSIATYVNGAAYKKFEPNLERRGLPIIKIAELKAGVTAQTAFSDVAMPEKYRIEHGDILFSWSGNPDTSIDTFVWHHGNSWLNQHIFRVIPNQAEEKSFVLQTLKYLRPVFAELARNKQTTGLGHVTVADLKALHVVRPDQPLLEFFNETISSVHAAIFENTNQTLTLSEIRDTLLPRLISGKLRLPDADAELEVMAS